MSSNDEEISSTDKKLNQIIAQLATLTSRLDQHDTRIAQLEGESSSHSKEVAKGLPNPQAPPLPFANGNDNRYQALAVPSPRISNFKWKGRSIAMVQALQAIFYFRVERDEGTPSWRRFSEMLHMRFGPPLHHNPLSELMHLRQTSTVDEYQTKFLALLTHANLSPEEQINIFTAGLSEPLRIDVDLEAPHSLEIAMSLARSYEHREQALSEAAKASLLSKPTIKGGFPAWPVGPATTLAQPSRTHWLAHPAVKISAISAN